MKTTTTTDISATDLVEPIHDILNLKYCAPNPDASMSEEEWIAENSYDLTDGLVVDPLDQPRSHQASIVIPDSALGFDDARRAIATLLWRSGSNRAVLEPDSSPLRGPLQFRLTRDLCWDDRFVAPHYLVANYVKLPDGGATALNVEKARRQVSGLVEFIADLNNLIEFPPFLSDAWNSTDSLSIEQLRAMVATALQRERPHTEEEMNAVFEWARELAVSNAVVRSIRGRKVGVVLRQDGQLAFRALKHPEGYAS